MRGGNGMAARTGNRVVTKVAWEAINEHGPMTVPDLLEFINNRKTRYGSPLKNKYTSAQVTQFLIRSPLFYPDPETPLTLSKDGRMRRADRPLWFVYDIDEVVRRLVSKTHMRTPLKSHPKFLRDAIMEKMEDEKEN
tara:strand:+ start:5495 stop:5905 length:411 start_codon:yes stop_codon:yes gene_type:complete